MTHISGDGGGRGRGRFRVTGCKRIEGSNHWSMTGEVFVFCIGGRLRETFRIKSVTKELSI